MLADGPVADLVRATNDVLSEPLRKLGVSQDVPPELTAALEQNSFYFSGFKTHHEMTEASRLMKGEDGTFKPFEQFQREVQRIDNTYNRSYLQAEYNFAVQSTQMAVKWKEWEKDGDDYDLQYRTAGDDRVRDEHAALDGTTLPPSDPFWDNYLPPLGWNCRCTAVQVRKGKYPQSDSAEAIAKGQGCTAKPKQQIFRFNPGKQEKIFPPKHPYFPKGCGSCQYKLSYDPSNPNCQACKAIHICSKDADQIQSSVWIRNTIDAVSENKYSCGRGIQLCDVPAKITDFATNNHVEIGNGKIIITDDALLHSIRDAKQKRGAALSKSEIHYCLTNLNSASIYYDESHKNFQFVIKHNEKTMKLVFGYRKEKVNRKKTEGIFLITSGLIQNYNINGLKKIK